MALRLAIVALWATCLKWDLTLAHWTQVSDRCPLGYLSHDVALMVMVDFCGEMHQFLAFKIEGWRYDPMLFHFFSFTAQDSHFHKQTPMWLAYPILVTAVNIFIAYCFD